MYTNSYIESTGSYIPKSLIKNEAFLERIFKGKKGEVLQKSTVDVVEKLEEITQIQERRYEMTEDTSFMAVEAGRAALEDSAFDEETIGGIIVAHNFGNIKQGSHQGHMIPNLAALVKHHMGIKNSRCFAFDVLYGCPGWLLALQQAHQHLQTQAATSVLVIGVESLSRVVNPRDVDSMLFGDGAGAVVLAAEKTATKRGIIGYDNFSDCVNEAYFLKMSKAIDSQDEHLFIDMAGRSVFKYAVTRMPQLITELLQRLSIPVKDIKQFLFHQANGKMLEAIGQQISKLHDNICISHKVPMTLQQLGNTSVATIPTMLDLMKRGKMKGFQFETGEKVVMASVGAGMHVNCMVYQY
ncbi:MAG: 3-oxoacyl-ACP synthase III family protein [Cyclobacteriaceae bacterium]